MMYNLVLEMYDQEQLVLTATPVRELADAWAEEFTEFFAKYIYPGHFKVFVEKDM